MKTKTTELIGAICAVISAGAAVIACVQASAAKSAAIEVNAKFESLKVQLTRIEKSPFFNLLGGSITIPPGCGGEGGSGAAGGGGGGSVFGDGGKGGQGGIDLSGGVTPTNLVSPRP